MSDAPQATPELNAVENYDRLAHVGRHCGFQCRDSDAPFILSRDCPMKQITLILSLLLITVATSLERCPGSERVPLKRQRPWMKLPASTPGLTKNEEQLRFSPISLSALGRKELYDQIDEMSVEAAEQQLDGWPHARASPIQL